jgi:hypothetical protein
MAAALSCLLAASVLAAGDGRLALRIGEESFNAVPENVEAVCRSAAGEILRHVPDYTPPRLLVIRGEGDPMVAFGTNEQGELVIRLTSDGTFWCQYAYQFAHEFCHVLCGFEDPARPGAYAAAGEEKANLWFEETLCETASLFALRAMARSWKDQAPYPNWRDFRDAFRSYTDDAVNKRGDAWRELARDGMRRFYEKRAGELAANCCNREVNGAMAAALLPLFEAEPAGWGALRYLNRNPRPEGQTFPAYMRTWLEAAPVEHRAFVASIAGLFGAGP